MDNKLLEDIFQKCLSVFVYNVARTDNATYHWDTEQTMLAELKLGKVDGICATFALLCRMELDSANIENTLIFCQDELSEFHLVCSVDGMIFDNRQTALKSNTTLELDGYKFIAESGIHKGDPWFSLPTNYPVGT